MRTQRAKEKTMRECLNHQYLYFFFFISTCNVADTGRHTHIHTNTNTDPDTNCIVLQIGFLNINVKCYFLNFFPIAVASAATVADEKNACEISAEIV